MATQDFKGTINNITPTAAAVGFTIAGGTTSKTLTVPLDASVSGTNTGDQAYASAAEVLAGTEAAKVIAPDQLAAANVRPFVLGTAVASTSGTSIDFTSIPSWVKRITVMLSGVSKNGTSNCLVQIGDSGGVETTDYIGLTTYQGGANVAAGVNVTSGWPSAGDAADVSVITATWRIVNFSGNTWVCSVTGMVHNAYSICGGGSKTLSGTLDRVRITTTNGTDTFDAGSVNILYE